MKIIAVVFIALFTGALTDDRSIYKTCEQSSFCRRCRNVENNNSPFELVSATLNTYSDSVTVDLVNQNNGHVFVLKVEGVHGDVFRVTIDEKTPLRQRYLVTDSLKENVKTEVIKVTESKTDIIITCGLNKAVIHATPFKIDFFRSEMLPNLMEVIIGSFHYLHNDNLYCVSIALHNLTVLSLTY